MTHKVTEETRAKVSSLAAFGANEDAIAKYIGVAPKTLRKYYREELDTSLFDKNLRVGNFLFAAASGDAINEGAAYSDCIRAAMFWAKTRMQWREKQEIDHTSSDGSMTPAPSIDASKLSDKALKELMDARAEDTDANE